MPGNFFSWVLRYPEQGAVIIVLRNGYGSTEHFEENLQAILFNQPPRLPGRSAKDIAAGTGLKLAGWLAAHIIPSALLLLALLGGMWRWSRQRKRGAQNAPLA